MDAFPALLLGVAAWSTSAAALALMYAQARRVVAGYPAAIRSRATVQERYASLEEPGASRRALWSLGQSGWTLFFLTFYFCLGLADFGVGIEVGSAVLLGIVWAASSYDRHRKDQETFDSEEGVPSKSGRWKRLRVRTAYRVLYTGVAVLWLVGCAFVGYGAAQLV